MSTEFDFNQLPAPRVSVVDRPQDREFDSLSVQAGFEHMRCVVQHCACLSVPDVESLRRNLADVCVVRCEHCQEAFFSKPSFDPFPHIDVDQQERAGIQLMKNLNQFGGTLSVFKPGDQDGIDYAFDQVGQSNRSKSCTFYIKRRLSDGSKVWIQPAVRAFDYQFHPNDVQFLLAQGWICWDPVAMNTCFECDQQFAVDLSVV